MLVHVVRFCSSFPSDFLVIECLPYLILLSSYFRNLALSGDPAFQNNAHWYYDADSESVTSDPIIILFQSELLLSTENTHSAQTTSCAPMFNSSIGSLVAVAATAGADNKLSVVKGFTHYKTSDYWLSRLSDFCKVKINLLQGERQFFLSGMSFAHCLPWKFLFRL